MTNVFVAAISLLTQYNKKKDLIFTPNFQISILNHETIKFTKIHIDRQKEVFNLLKKPNYQQSNLTAEEILELKCWSENHNLIIKRVNKGEKTTGYRR